MKFIVLVILFFAVTFSATFAKQKNIFCYNTSWSIYQKGNGQVEIEDLDPHLCTHLIYSFVGITRDAQVYDLDSRNGALNGLLHQLKKKNPNLKIMVALGGWDEGSEKYSLVMNSENLRKVLVNNITKFTQDFNLDGFDIHWKFPGERNGASTDRIVFVEFLKELRHSFDSINTNLLITAAVGSSKSLTRTGYNVPEICKHLDFINLLAYDYKGGWSDTTGQNAPLYSKSGSVDGTIQHWIRLGAPPEKLILGISIFGRTFTLKSPNENQLNAPTSGPGQSGQYTNEAGFMTYLEICETFKNDGDWHKQWDDVQKNPFAFKKDQWLGYDNIESVKLKAEYAIEHNLGGVMVWAIDMDDVNNICGDGKFPILNTINKIINITAETAEPGKPMQISLSFSNT